MSRRAWTHVIVGAGAAGCALAARLAEDPDLNVLLLEAGGPGRDPALTVPMMTGVVMHRPAHTWRYRTDPEPGLAGRVIDLPRGRVLGGSTAINGMVHVRGLPEDYDSWAQQGMPGWSWEALKPLFLRSEGFRGPGGEVAQHGLDGPLTLSRRTRPVSPLAEVFIAAGLAAGHPACPDFNAEAPEGFGWYHFARRSGRRLTAAQAYLAGAAARRNLTLRTGREADRLLFRDGRAAGLELRHGRGQEVVETEGEIILAAGAIGSPLLLQRSGIGPAAELAALDIRPQVDLPGVGRNLQDHVLIRVAHAAREDATLHGLTRVDRAAAAFLRAWLFGSGPMNVFPLEAGAYLRSPGADLPDLQSHFLPALSTATVRLNPFRPAGECRTGVPGQRLPDAARQPRPGPAALGRPGRGAGDPVELPDRGRGCGAAGGGGRAAARGLRPGAVRPLPGAGAAARAGGHRAPGGGALGSGSGGYGAPPVRQLPHGSRCRIGGGPGIAGAGRSRPARRRCVGVSVDPVDQHGGAGDHGRREGGGADSEPARAVGDRAPRRVAGEAREGVPGGSARGGGQIDCTRS